MKPLVSTSPRETQRVAAALATLLEEGDVVLLLADLGAGKTTFVQGFVRALGVAEPAQSPTFIVAQTFDGKKRVHHLDCYRLNQKEMLEMGIDDYLSGTGEVGPGIVLIEWAERIKKFWPKERLEVRIAIRPRSTDRTIRVKGTGARLRGVARKLGEKLAVKK